MSARRRTVGPGEPPSTNAVTELSPWPRCGVSPSRRSSSTISACVSGKSSPISGCRCIRRRSATTSSWMAWAEPRRPGSRGIERSIRRPAWRRWNVLPGSSAIDRQRDHVGRRTLEAEGPVALPELVTRARDGDHDAFATLVRAMAARLDTTAWLIVRDHDLARDAVQEALLRAWRDLPRLRDPGRFDGWLHRLLVNTCLEAVRRRRRRSIEVELQPFHERSVSDPAVLVGDWDGLERAFDHRTAEQRATIVLRYFVGLSVEDVAAAFRIPTGTVKSRLNRSLAMMRVTLVIERGDVEGRPA